MRIGVLGTVTQPTVYVNTDPIVYNPALNTAVGNAGLLPSNIPNAVTYGIDVNGNTLVCPVGYPFDSTLKDCRGYAGSPVDLAQQALQGQMDGCTSGGGTWDTVNNVCVPVATVATSLISGVPNSALYIAGAALLLFAFMGGHK